MLLFRRVVNPDVNRFLYIPRDYNYPSRFNQQYENLHNILLQEDGIEVRRLFRLWEKLRLRASEFKNHRIFTLRCLHNDLIPVSIKLKSTVKSARANKILRKAEKELLQARVKSINFILDNTSKQLEECRSQLVAIFSTQRLRECQDFVDKVGEISFNKVKQRQLNKFNLLTIRKEGNITRSNNTNTNNHNLNSQANSQVNSSQAREGNAPSQATTLPPREGNSLSQASTPLPPGEANASPAAAVLPGEGSGSSQATPLPSWEASTSPAAAVLPGEGSSSSQATPLPSGEASTSPAAAVLPGEGSSSSQATPLPSREASTSPAAAVLPGEGSSSSQATPLPPGEASTSPTTAVLSREGSGSSQATTLLPSSHPPRSSSPTGQVSNPTSAVRQGSRCPPRHRSTQASQEVKATSWEGNTSSTPPLGLPKVLLMRNLTLSGSSTSPTNL